MRLIDGDALIEQIEKNQCEPCKKRKEDYNGVRCRACQYGDEIDDIEDAPTVMEWIPCSERLPEENKYVLVCTKGRLIQSITDGLYDGKCWYIALEDVWVSKDEIVAWMPLPEPWKGEK